jgi:hypothetical protein
MLKARFAGGPIDLAFRLYQAVALLFFHGETEIGNRLTLDDHFVLESAVLLSRKLLNKNI